MLTANTYKNEYIYISIHTDMYSYVWMCTDVCDYIWVCMVSMDMYGCV